MLGTENSERILKKCSRREPTVIKLFTNNLQCANAMKWRFLLNLKKIVGLEIDVGSTFSTSFDHLKGHGYLKWPMHALSINITFSILSLLNTWNLFKSASTSLFIQQSDHYSSDTFYHSFSDSLGRSPFRTNWCLNNTKLLQKTPSLDSRKFPVIYFIDLGLTIHKLVIRQKILFPPPSSSRWGFTCGCTM